jgi:uncharacterized protein YbjT (DUF2867 family)
MSIESKTNKQTINTMSQTKVLVTGATGGIGSHAVTRLVESGVATTIFARNEEKARQLFAKEFETGLLTFAKGDLDDVEAFKNAVKGQTRLLLLVADLERMAQIKGTFGRIAYESGVKQIVDISSFTVPYTKKGFISYAHTTGEEVLFKAANETGNNLVALRPGNFMTNHLHQATHSIKHMNKIIGVGTPENVSTHIDPRDIADVAVSIFLDPVEKHGNYVYDVQTEVLSNKQRAEIFSRVLGRQIVYEQVDYVTFYDSLINMRIPHKMAYDFVTLGAIDFNNPIPQLEILTRKPLRTFENWVKENKQAFE